MAADGEVTRLLRALANGDAAAMDRLLPLVYRELHRIAHRQMRGERTGHTLQTTALVHEAYLKLVASDRMPWQNRAHFLAAAARAMRQILVNYALARRTQKRGGASPAISLDDTSIAIAKPGEELLMLDEALRALAALDERQSRVVECRFFAGMSIEETAVALSVSPITVKRDWTVARAWLQREMAR